MYINTLCQQKLPALTEDSYSAFFWCATVSSFLIFNFFFCFTSKFGFVFFPFNSSCGSLLCFHSFFIYKEHLFFWDFCHVLDFCCVVYHLELNCLVEHLLSLFVQYAFISYMNALKSIEIRSLSPIFCLHWSLFVCFLLL